jgi:hypothetical protein
LGRRIEESPDGAGSYKRAGFAGFSCRRRLRPPIFAFPIAWTDLVRV